MGTNEVDLKALDADLQKLPKPKRGWIERNWKWFVPLLVLLMILAGGGGYAGWFYHRIFGNEAYQYAMSKIVENTDVVAALGKPIKTLYLSPTPSISKDDTEIRWTITGPNEKQAKVHVSRRLMNGKWETNIAEVTLPGEKKISLIGEDEGNLPPPFVPQPAPAADGKPGDKAAGKPAEENMPEDITPNIPPPEESK